MHIWNVCLTHDPALAGMHRAVHDFSRALDAPVLSFDDGGGGRGGSDAGIVVRRITGGRGWLSRGFHVMPAAAARQADETVAGADLLVVHSLFRAHAPWAERWTRRHQRRYWAVPHGCLDPWGLSHRGLLKRLWLRLQGAGYLANAERILFSSQRSLAKARRWIPHGRGVVVPWPVDLPTLAGRDAARGRFRSMHGIPAAARLLLFVGRLHTVKRPLETIAAFCAAAGNGCHLAIVGMDGDLTRQQLRDAIPAACRDRVHLVGPLSGSDLAAAYLASDGFISLSFQENFGYAAAEASAFGLPAILSPGHDLAHEMPARDGRFACGWLLPDDSHAEAVAAIRGFAAATDESLAAAGELGRKWVGETLSFDRFQSTLAALAAAGPAGSGSAA